MHTEWKRGKERKENRGKKGGVAETIQERREEQENGSAPAGTRARFQDSRIENRESRIAVTQGLALPRLEVVQEGESDSTGRKGKEERKGSPLNLKSKT